MIRLRNLGTCSIIYLKYKTWWLLCNDITRLLKIVISIVLL